MPDFLSLVVFDEKRRDKVNRFLTYQENFGYTFNIRVFPLRKSDPSSTQTCVRRKLLRYVLRRTRRYRHKIPDKTTDFLTNRLPVSYPNQGTYPRTFSLKEGGKNDIKENRHRFENIITCLSCVLSSE